MGSESFKRRMERVSPEIKILSGLLMDVSDQINEYLEREGISQRELAEKLGKSEAEISKWMSGSHNFTFRTIAKISAALERPLVTTLLYVDELPEEEKKYVFDKLAKDLADTSSKIEIPSSLHDLEVEKISLLDVELERKVTFDIAKPPFGNSKILDRYKE